MKEKIKQFLCGLAGHRTTSATAKDSDNTMAYHLYCADCKKTLSIFISDDATEKQKEFVLKKI